VGVSARLDPKGARITRRSAPPTAPAAAFGYLTRVSQNSNVRIRDIAQTLVDAFADQTRRRDQ